MADEVLTKEGVQQGWILKDSKGKETTSYLLPVVIYTQRRPDPSALSILSPAPGSTTAIVKVYAKVDNYDGVPEELQYNSENWGTFKLVATYKDGKFKFGGSLGSTNANELLGQALGRWNNASPSNAGRVAPLGGQLLAGANRAASDGGNIPPGGRNKLGLYKGAVSGQLQPDPTDKQPGASPTNTSLENGSGAPSSPEGLPASTFQITVKDFQKDENYNEYKSFLKYPRNMNKGQDRIMFVQKRYVAPDILNNDGKVNTDKIKAGNLSTDRFSDSKQDILGTVTLPMPNDISETNVTAWGEDSLSSLAALVGGAALGGTASLSSGNFSGTMKELQDLFSEAVGGGPASETIKQLLTINAAAQLTNKAGININPEAFRSRITGTAINPNLELLFQGPKLRSFGFQFKMTPRSEQEAESIRRIIKFFKKGMAPKRSSDEKAAYFLGAPNIFDIHFRAGEYESTGWDNDLASIGKIKTCALQQCLVNYTPDGFYAAFQDSKVRSQPIAVTMQLAFTELTPLYNDNYTIETDSVGWDNFGDIRKFESNTGNGGAPGDNDEPPQPPPEPAGQLTSPARTLIQDTSTFKPTLGLPGA